MEILTALGVSFTSGGVDVDETPLAGERPDTLASRLAGMKARAAHEFHDRPVLGADTVVACDERIFGKPRSEQEALDMLATLSGRRHEVVTGLALLVDGRLHSDLSRTTVHFRDIDPDEARRYWQSGEPAGKAGAYAIQGFGGVFVESNPRQLFRRGRPARFRNRQAAGDSGTGPYARCRKGIAGRMTDESQKEEILVNVTPREVRAALLENGILQEVHIERAARRGIISNIYKGKVSRVLPGMQAAFVDIGLERTAFLHASDIVNGKAPANGEATADIRELVRDGDEVLVQVVKDPIGTKGARLSTFITLPSRYLVLLPDGDGVGVSARIEDETERERLRGLLEDMLQEIEGAPGVIVRTAAEGAPHEALRADLKFLSKLWSVVQVQCRNGKVKTLVHEDLSLPIRIMRDMVTSDVEQILVDSQQDFEKMKAFAAGFLPELVPKLNLYEKRRPIFDLHGTEDEIKKALDRSIPLKSGGYVIFDQTEAMTTIDVNTGGYVGHRNLEETIYRTNLEAAVAIARQLRLRNLGGIIIIDFIDMEVDEHRRQVMQTLQQSLARDHARHQITPLSPLGLIEMTRKRTRESLQHILCDDCSNCEGRGFVMTAETVCFEILREIIRQHRQFTFDELLVLAHQDVIDLLLDGEANGLLELEQRIGKPIRLQPESLYLQDQFDVVLI